MFLNLAWINLPVLHEINFSATLNSVEAALNLHRSKFLEKSCVYQAHINEEWLSYRE